MIIRRRRKFSLLEIFAERYESPTTTTTAPAAISCKNGFILGCATKINIPVIPATIIAVLLNVILPKSRDEKKEEERKQKEVEEQLERS